MEDWKVDRIVWSLVADLGGRGGWWSIMQFCPPTTMSDMWSSDPCIFRARPWDSFISSALAIELRRASCFAMVKGVVLAVTGARDEAPCRPIAEAPRFRVDAADAVKS
jgi:hypothetical protein